MNTPQEQITPETQKNKSKCFSFGDPEPVLNRTVADYCGLFLNSEHEYYEPPVSLDGLAKIRTANAHHCTIPYFKRNQLTKWFIENSLISMADLGKAAFDYMVFGNAYLQIVTNRLGHIIKLKHVPALYTRKLKTPNRYCFLRSGKSPIKFKKGEVIHLKEYDPLQFIYGLPEYFGGIQSILLNESATLFRRKYYDNGAHMGYIFYTTDADFEEEDEDALKKEIENSKGVGNFRSMFLNLPNGKKDSVQIIPVGDIATKDEFERIKNISRNDILSIWRIQPALAGVMPDNAGGFGDIEKISRVYHENETVPLQNVFLGLNEHLPSNKKIAFTKPEFN